MKYFMENIRSVFVKLLKLSGFEPVYSIARSGYLKDSGWFNSFKSGVPIDINNNPIPWYTYPSIVFIEKRINRDMVVFEYGCGSSTLWWASRVKQVISCEHSKEWFETVKRQVPANVILHHIEMQPGGEYSQKITEYHEKFDIVIIDGRDRVNCSKNCLPALKKGGVVIWDNSDREEYREGQDYLSNFGYNKIDFEGIGPVNVYSWSTSVFYNKYNCFGI